MIKFEEEKSLINLKFNKLINSQKYFIFIIFNFIWNYDIALNSPKSKTYF